jgi:hypothetical protein
MEMMGGTANTVRRRLAPHAHSSRKAARAVIDLSTGQHLLHFYRCRKGFCTSLIAPSSNASLPHLPRPKA